MLVLCSFMILLITIIIFLKSLLFNALTNRFLNFKTHFFIDFFTNFAIIRTVFATNNQFIPLLIINRNEKG